MLRQVGLPQVLLLATLARALLACSGDSKPERTSEAVCSVTSATSSCEPALHYPDVAPIFEQRCASCHTGVGDGPWPLDSYANVASWAAVVRDELERCSMPPPDSEVPLPAGEREQILAWIACGYPK